MSPKVSYLQEIEHMFQITLEVASHVATQASA
jgi:hypothetical protein